MHAGGLSPTLQNLTRRGCVDPRNINHHGEWLERVVALDVLAWLDPARRNLDHGLAIKAHRAIVVACRKAKHEFTNASGVGTHSRRDLGLFRRQIITGINRVSQLVLNEALHALNAAKGRDVRYRVDGPFGHDGGGCTTDFGFGDLVFGQPDVALEALMALRQLDPLAQAKVAALLAAKGTERLGVSSSFNHRVPVRIRKAWLRKGEKSLAQTQQGSEPLVHRLAEDVWRGFQCMPGDVPVALEVPVDASDALLKAVAKNYRDLMGYLRDDLVRRPVGSKTEAARSKQAWLAYRGCGVACEVVAAWLTALSAGPATALCEFCYRHRETRRRCRVHSSPNSETAEARLGKRLAGAFVQRVRLLEKQPDVKKALAADLAADALDLGAIERARLVDLPDWLQRHVVILAAQLRALWPVLNGKQAFEVGHLFADLLRAAAALQTRASPKTLSEMAERRSLRAAALELTSLNGFLRTWWGTGGVAAAVLGVRCRGFDPGHPLVRHGVQDLSIAHALLLQRAWQEVETEFKAHTSIDRGTVLAMKEQGLSLRRIAQALNCSHQKVWQVMNQPESAEPKRRSHLEPYR